MVPNTTSSRSYAGNNSTVVSYALPFKFFKGEHLTVTVTSAEGVSTSLAITSGFTVTGEGADEGGTLKTVAAVPGTSTILIERNTPMLNLTDWNDVETWRAHTLESNFDWLAMAAIDADRRASTASETGLNASLRVPSGESIPAFGDAASRASKVPVFDVAGDPTLMSPTEIVTASNVEVAVDVAAAVAAAAEAQEAAALVVLPPHERADRAQWLQKKMRAFDVPLPPLGTYLPLVAFGDSKAPQIGQAMYNELSARYGVGAVVGGFISTGMQVDGTSKFSITLDAGVTADTVAGYWPGGAFHNVPDGKYVQYTLPANMAYRNGWRKVTFILGQRVGGGTAQFKVTQNGTDTATGSLATAGSAGTMLSAELTEADGVLPGASPTIRITASGGSVYVLGIMAWRDRGVVPFELSHGGSTLATQNAIPTASLSFFNTLLGKPALMIHHFYEEDETGADLAAHLVRAKTYFPETTHLYVAGTPSNAEASIITETTERAICNAAGVTFFAAYAMFQSLANLTALGWQGDGLHLSAEVHRYIFQCIATVLPPLAFSQSRVEVARQRVRSMLPDIMSCEMHWQTFLNKQTSNGTIREPGNSASPNVKALFFTDSGASPGYAAAAIMSVVSNSANALRLSDPLTLALRISGMTFPAGTTGWIQLGSTGDLTAPNKAIKSIGIDFARPEDVGLVAIGNAAVRLWAYDGVTLVEGPWVLTSQSATSIANTMILRWEPGKLSLLHNADWDNDLREITCIRSAATGSIASYVHAGVASTVNAQAVLGIINVKFYANPYVTMNNLVEPWAI
jgi:hypothetical protein